MMRTLQIGKFLGLSLVFILALAVFPVVANAAPRSNTAKVTVKSLVNNHYRPLNGAYVEIWTASSNSDFIPELKATGITNERGKVVFSGDWLTPLSLYNIKIGSYERYIGTDDRGTFNVVIYLPSGLMLSADEPLE